ncbi:hypothetical protein J3R83DRAFT_11936 [Lanmaoa asiatica]|nr:hypothetical protein J3R83DRAFT_11936 [Lanmaoa asiatica]
MRFTGPLSRILGPKWTILTGLSTVAVATALVATGGSRPENHWPYTFPALSVGSAGAMLAYSHIKQVRRTPIPLRHTLTIHGFTASPSSAPHRHPWHVR